MQKITHKFKVLRKQRSMILVNPVTIEKNLFALKKTFKAGCFREVVFVER